MVLRLEQVAAGQWPARGPASGSDRAARAVLKVRPDLLRPAALPSAKSVYLVPRCLPSAAAEADAMRAFLPSLAREFSITLPRS